MVDERLYQVAQRRAPVDEVLAATDQYRRRHPGWNAKHFYAWYKRAGGKRGYACVKRCLQEGKLIEPARKHAPHGKRRERAALVGMMLHQDGSRHEWFPDQLWDLIVTMDDATGEHTQAVFCGPRRLARYNRLDKSISYEQNLALCACVIWKRWR